MAWTSEQADALRAAIASGVQTVTFDRRTVTYHSIEDMRSLLAEMERGLSATTAQAYRLAAHDKGV